MHNRLNIQYIISYLGLIPFFLILIDKYYFFQIKEDISTNFLINYNLIILVFIGSMNWNLELKIKKNIAIYGFLPSFFATVIIMLNLYGYGSNKIFLFLILANLLQLVFDYILIYLKQINKQSFYYLRLPLTISIIVVLIIFKI